MTPIERVEVRAYAGCGSWSPRNLAGLLARSSASTARLAEAELSSLVGSRPGWVLPAARVAAGRTILALTSLLSGVTAVSASPVMTTIVGHIATISPPVRGLGVNVGDTFGLSLTFDPDLGVHSETVVGGTHYDLMTDSFYTGMDGWYGSLPTFLAARHPVPSSWAVKQSWFRPVTTLHHEEWFIGTYDLYLITNYRASGGESYGWYGYGDPSGTIEFLIDRVTTVPVIANPISEPGSLPAAIAALLACIAAFRRKSSLPEAPA